LLIQPSREDEYLFVWDVCSTSPAARAGIEKGDVILALNGEEVVNTEDGFDLTAYQDALLNDDSIKFTIQQGPDQAPAPVTIDFGGVGGCPGWVRGILSESPRVGYIRIPNFGGESNTVLFELIQELEEDAPLEGLIVDVRHNPGGNSDRDIALFTMGVFGTTGKLREGATQVIYRIRGPVGWSETTPVVVLTDGSSHSAAEYFATAMQQSGRATIVGMPTAGNTEGITGFSLPDGSVIRLAVMILTLPDGSQLEDIGVQPDISVPNGMWGMKERVQLQAAYDTLLEQIE
jgi:carboxyl-terminal processing protease